MRYFDLVVYSVYSDLRTEVSRRFLGFLWWVIEPVMYMATFYVVFGLALKQGGEGYVAFLLVGMSLWKWFDGSVRLASAGICNNYWLSQQIHLPKIVFVIIPLLTNLVKFTIVLVLLVLFLFLTETPGTSHWWALLPILVCQLFFIFCMSVMFASFLPFFQDLRQILDNLMMLLMFMSGVFYRVDTTSGVMSDFFSYNPMFHLVHAFRELLLHNVLPNWHELGFVLLAGLPMGIIGAAMIWRYDRHYPKILV